MHSRAQQHGKTVPKATWCLSPSLPRLSPRTAHPKRHLLPEQLAAHPAPETGARVGGTLPLRLLHATLRPLAHGTGAAVRLHQHLCHRNDERFGSREARPGSGGVAGAGLGQHPHLICSGREVSGGRGVRGRRGEPGWAGGEASRQGSSSGCEPGWREAARQPQKPPSPCEEVTQRQPPLPGGPHTFNSRPAARCCCLGRLEGLPGLLTAVIRYPPLSASLRHQRPRPPEASLLSAAATPAPWRSQAGPPGLSYWHRDGILGSPVRPRDRKGHHRIPSACPGPCQPHCQGVMWWGRRRRCRQCPSPGRVPACLPAASDRQGHGEVPAWGVLLPHPARSSPESMRVTLWVPAGPGSPNTTNLPSRVSASPALRGSDRQTDGQLLPAGTAGIVPMTTQALLQLSHPPRASSRGQGRGCSSSPITPRSPSSPAANLPTHPKAWGPDPASPLRSVGTSAHSLLCLPTPSIRLPSATAWAPPPALTGHRLVQGSPAAGSDWDSSEQG